MADQNAPIQLTQAQLNQLITAAVQAAQGANPPQPGAFAVTPSLVTNTPIDYSTKAGAAIYEKATQKLEHTFSLEEPNITTLLAQLRAKTTAHGWKNLFLVTDSNGDQLDFLEKHSKLTESEVKAHADALLQNDDRTKQNDFQLYTLITSSVDSSTTTRMASEEKRYTCGDPNVPANYLPSGIMYLKILLKLAEVDTRATSAHIRKQLSQLPTYIVKKAKNDIKAFNEHAQRLLDRLAARGEKADDAILHLLDAYENTDDTNFTNWADRTRETYELNGMEVDDLMQAALQKYQTLVQADKWCVLSQQQREIVALRAQLNNINLKSKTTPKKSGDDAKKTKKVVEVGGKKFVGKWAWRGIPPKPGEPTTKTFEDAEWHYCEHHGYWAKHLGTDCLMNKSKSDDEPAGPTDKENMGITAAMADLGVADVISDEDDE